VRTGNTIRVTGTIASSPVPSLPIIGGSSARSQTVAIFDNIEHSLQRLMSSLKDVVRTRVIIRNEQDNEEVSRVHDWVFGCLGIKPASTLIIAGIVGEGPLVEIEAEAEVGGGDNGVLRISDLI